MPVTKAQKDEILKGLIDKFSRSKTVVFADYRGLDVKAISDLRSKLREGDAEARVAKKTLIKLAAKDQKIDELPSEVMEGPVAAVFSYEDALSGIQILYKFAKDNENLKLLGGIIDGEVIGPDVVKQYAQLPSREELLAKLVGSMQAPISGYVGILGNLLGGFVRVINAYKDTLPADDTPAPAAEEKAEEKPAEEEKTAEEAPKEEASAEAEKGTEEAPVEPEVSEEEVKDAVSEDEAADIETEAAEEAAEEKADNA